MSAPVPTARGNLIAAAGTLLWATSFPVADLLLENWAPVPLASARLLLAGLTTAFLAFAFGEARLWRQAPVREVLVLGGLCMGGSLGLFVMGQKATGGATAAIIGACLPIVTALMDISAGTRLTARVVIGALLAVTGAAIVTLQEDLGGFALSGGEPFLIGGMLLWALYSRNAGKRLGMLPTASQSSLTALAGGLALMTATLVLGPLGLVDMATSFAPRDLALAFWMGSVAVGLSLPLWLVAVRLLGLTAASIHQNMAPVWVLLMGLMMGGGFRWQQAVGAILVIAGAVISQLRDTQGTAAMKAAKESS